ncbi:hypothetical protein SDC9_128505 [bioreactor metagenome]|uniref:DNA alkylation repair enzyme n=1 Tax=bioreactor metagenome TaxID=1076179 RepID=A0A645CXM2_9ZZZZ|nr:hypothetical protein [Paludibacter sp.]
MNYRAFFEHLQSRYHLEELLLYLDHHPQDFDELFAMVFEAEEKIAWRVLWACEKVSQRTPEWFDEKKIQMITDLVLTTKHHGLHRIGLSILNSFPVPDPLNIDMLNALYEWMLSPKYSIGVQSLAMKLLYKYTLTNEDLLREFIITLEQVDENDYTMAFTASKRNILKKHN